MWEVEEVEEEPIEEEPSSASAEVGLGSEEVRLWELGSYWW